MRRARRGVEDVFRDDFGCRGRLHARPLALPLRSSDAIPCPRLPSPIPLKHTWRHARALGVHSIVRLLRTWAVWCFVWLRLRLVVWPTQTLRAGCLREAHCILRC